MHELTSSTGINEMGQIAGVVGPKVTFITLIMCSVSVNLKSE